MIAAVLLAALAFGPGEPALDVDTARYNPGVTGSVSGRVYAERRRPDAPDQPLATTVVTLVPRSPRLLERLDEIRRHARDSVDRYRAAAPAIRKTREDYELGLWNAGRPDLVIAGQVDADGRFSFPGVPRGEWLVFGWHAAAHDVTTRPETTRERGTFVLPPRLDRWSSITVWLTPVTVDAETDVSVELTDRNAWFTGVVEEMKPGAGR